jgi:ATP-dependent Clp protease protease subunit
MAGDETLIAPTGMLMIHNPATTAFGNKEAMQKAIELLDEVKESIINAYEEKSGLSRSKIARMMDEETWLNAKKAQSLGLVDGILFASGQPKPEEDPDEGDEDTPDEDEPKEDTLTAMSYSRAATMQSLMQKVSAEHKGTPVDQLMSRLNLLKY